MIEAQFRPLPKWTESRSLENRRSPFKSAYVVSLNTLEYELEKLEATNIVIQAGFDRRDIRNDGWPYSGKSPKHNGVVLYFQTPRGGAMRFPCGTYNSYQSNIHAIALTLASLRAIDRYGVTFGKEQYAGFRQIAAPAEDSLTDPETAARYIAQHSGSDYWNRVLTDPSYAQQQFKIAVAAWHPDRRDGRRDVFEKLIIARNTIDEHQGIGI